MKHGHSQIWCWVSQPFALLGISQFNFSIGAEKGYNGRVLPWLIVHLDQLDCFLWIPIWSFCGCVSGHSVIISSNKKSSLSNFNVISNLNKSKQSGRHTSIFYESTFSMILCIFNPLITIWSLYGRVSLHDEFTTELYNKTSRADIWRLNSKWGLKHTEGKTNAKREGR